jgi:hypothetical protein
MTDDDLTAEVERVAAGIAATKPDRLDHSEASLAVIEEMLAEAAEFVDGMTDEQVVDIAQQIGCYVLEVGRRAHGGRYVWHEGRAAPVLLVGEPAFRVAMLAWDKTEGRLRGAEADSIPFFYAGFAGRVRTAQPGDDVLYV